MASHANLQLTCVIKRTACCSVVKADIVKPETIPAACGVMGVADQGVAVAA
jgi:hypothetical protein